MSTLCMFWAILIVASGRTLQLITWLVAFTLLTVSKWSHWCYVFAFLFFGPAGVARLLGRLSLHITHVVCNDVPHLNSQQSLVYWNLHHTGISADCISEIVQGDFNCSIRADTAINHVTCYFYTSDCWQNLYSAKVLMFYPSDSVYVCEYLCAQAMLCDYRVIHKAFIGPSF
jgi:hypothetical protein